MNRRRERRDAARQLALKPNDFSPASYGIPPHCRTSFCASDIAAGSAGLIYGAISVEITPAGGGEKQLVFVAGGILDVQPKLITVLADTSIRCKDLDEAKATEALRRAEEARAKAQDKQEIAAVESELSSLAAQLAAIRKLRKK